MDLLLQDLCATWWRSIELHLVLFLNICSTYKKMSADAGLLAQAQPDKQPWAEAVLNTTLGTRNKHGIISTHFFIY